MASKKAPTEGSAALEEDFSSKTVASSNAPRRSSRRISSAVGVASNTPKAAGDKQTQSATGSAAATNEPKGMGMKPGPPKNSTSGGRKGRPPGVSPSESDTTAAAALQRQMEGNAEGVGTAIEGLARMERRLQRDVKRQKLKIEESVALIAPDSPEQNAFKPRPTRFVRGPGGDPEGGEINPAADPLPTPERETIESCIENNTEGQSQKEEGDVVSELPSPVERLAARPPPVNSSYLPLPWTGRLGYACLNTYLRSGRTPVFSSRTCRMSSIIDHRYPLQDPSQPEHSMRNRPDKSKDAEVRLGQIFVQQLGLANARDIVKMLRWNERYGIRFFRLSSEMFPFASHHEHGYKLAPFASEVLAEAGKVAAQFGHRLTTHPGQFTQLGSPRNEVISASVRDLEYHDEMLSLLRLPPQQDRDAVMILHLGGTYGDKDAAKERFRANYTSLLSDSIKRRLVLENDDVSWSVHDLLPLCEELNIPMVLDFHHHNIVFDESEVREGTADLESLMPRIRRTWERKGITMKMHYSEPCAGAVTPRDRRKHSPRVATLPPCPADVDLMIEAKDKEQAVFELMRNFRLPGFERVSDMIPYERTDEPAPPSGGTARTASGKTKKKSAKPAKGRKKKGNETPERTDDTELDDVEEEEAGKERCSSHAKDGGAPGGPQITEEEIGMGGPDGRVYWPPGMEEWLRPRKRDQKRKPEDDDDLMENP